MAERGKNFADIVYTILVVEKNPDIEAVATVLGMTYAVLHSRLINRTCFSADEIRALIRTVPDPRLVSYLLEGTKFVAADRAVADLDAMGQQSERSALRDAIQRAATRVVVEAADVLEIVDTALAGGGMDHREERLVLKEINETEQALASLRVRIENT